MPRERCLGFCELGLVLPHKLQVLLRIPFLSRLGRSLSRGISDLAKRFVVSAVTYCIETESAGRLTADSSHRLSSVTAPCGTRYALDSEENTEQGPRSPEHD